METKKKSSAPSNKEAKKTEKKVNAECLTITKDYLEDYFAYSRNSKSSGLSGLLNDRTSLLKNPEITTRQVNSWDSYGLIDVDREGKEWRKYSIMDAVWLNIIAELRIFGVSIDIIRKVKQSLEVSSEIIGTPMPMLEYCVYRVLMKTEHIVLLVFSDGSAFPISYEQYFLNVYSGKIKDHVLLDLSELLQRNFETNKETLLNKIDGKELSEEEIKFLKFIRNGRYDKVSVTINNKKMDRIEAIERVNIKRTISDVQNEFKFQNVEFKEVDGKIVSIKRTVKKQIKDIE